MRRFLGWVLVSLCAVVGVLALGAGSALASGLVSSFGSVGHGAGQFDNVQGLAVNQETGDVYLADSANDRVDEFAGSGAFVRAWGWGVADGTSHALQTCTSTCFKGLAFRGVNGNGVGDLLAAEGIAVDNDPLSLYHGYVYVVDGAHNRVQVFNSEGVFVAMFGGKVNKNVASPNVCLAVEATECQEGVSATGNGEFKEVRSVAVGSTGDVYVGDENRVQRFGPTGTWEASLALTSAKKTERLAVGSGEDVYEASQSVKGVREWEFATKTLLHTYDSTATSEPYFTLDSSGDVFVAEKSGSGRGLVQEFESSGTERVSFPDPGEAEECALEATEGLSGECEATTGVVFAEKPAQGLYDAKNLAVRGGSVPAVVAPDVVESSAVAGVPSSDATLKAKIIPEAHETTYHFEYGTSVSYGHSTAGTVLTAGFFADSVSVPLEHLAADTTYYYRVVAVDSEGHTSDGPDQTFTTNPAAGIEGLSVGEATATGAVLQARVNPFGEDTKYRFEYAQAGGGYEKTTEVDLGSGTSYVAVSARVRELQPGVLYDYRLVAVNALGEALASGMFSTQPATGKPPLLDGRVYERVTPAEKGTASLQGVGAGNDGGIEVGLYATATDGDGLAFPVLNTLGSSQPTRREGGEWVARRGGEGGWSSRYVGSPGAEGPFAAGGENLVSNGSGVMMFSPDLSQVVFQPEFEVEHTTLLLSPKASEPTVYLRSEAACQGPDQIAEGCFEPLVTGKEGYSNVAPGAKFGSVPGQEYYGVHFDNANPDLSHVLLTAEEPLTVGAPPAGLYEWATGRLQPVESASGVAPDTSVNVAGLGEATIRHAEEGAIEAAISADGTRVAFAGAGNSGLFLRDTARGATVRLDAVQPGAVGVQSESKPLLEAASADLSRIFFLDDAPLTPGASATPEVPGFVKESDDLYVCEVLEEPSGPSCRLRDLSLPVNAGERAHALRQQVLGVSGDGDTVYFVAEGVFTTQANGAGETAVSGADNVYMARRGEGGAWTTTFVAKISVAENANGSFNRWGGADVSPNGEYLAFTSSLSAGGFSTRDAVSGEPDYEVYLYDAQDGPVGRLTCASCNPDGAQPDGMYIPFETDETVPLVDYGARYLKTWVASLLASPQTPTGKAGPTSRPHSLSDEGRLFFDSHDALVPQDQNGTWDVYEYEPPGTGGCTAAGAQYAQRLGGCLGLVSSGESSEESAFVEASESGDDVFFLTSSQLVPEDKDVAYDIYDAHVCTSAAPCAPGLSVAPECSTVESCRVAPEPQPSIFGSPSSATFSGPGNAAPASAPGAGPSLKKTVKKKTAKCAKGRRRVRGRCVKVKAKKGGNGKGSGARAGVNSDQRRGK